MVDLASVGNSVLPQVKVYGSAFVSMMTWLIFIVIFTVVAVGIAIVVIIGKQYNNKIIIFEKINGRWVDSKKDKAKMIKFGDLGVNLLWLRKHKKFLPIPAKQSGIRKWYFRVRGDGMWENFEMVDDESPNKLAFYSVDKHLIERNVGVRKGITERYKGGSWIMQNLPIIFAVTSIVIIFICLWLFMDKWMKLSETQNAGMESTNKVLDKTDTILSKLDNLLAKAQGGAEIQTQPS